jgi:GntR family transcriptional regulator
MVITIDPADARPIYIQITDEVRRGIVLGRLNPDDPLPSVRQLAADLRVNPNTVQQAYRELERDNLVYVLRGQGTFVAATAEAMVAEERKALANGVAKRAIQEAYRHGLDADELIDAIRAADASRSEREEEQGES